MPRQVRSVALPTYSMAPLTAANIEPRRFSRPRLTLLTCRNVYNDFWALFRRRGELDPPSEVWFLGLGHLGQALVWTLSLGTRARNAVLQEFDRLAPRANVS